MNAGPADHAAPSCTEVVELLTAYLDGALGESTDFETHLADCAGCRAALAQFRSVIDLTARLTADDITAFDQYVQHRFVMALNSVRRR